MEIVAKCGNRCDLCPAYMDNLPKYGAERISDGWNKYLGFYLPPDKIECFGCNNEGRRPIKSCSIRSCSIKRGFENCGQCGDMICALLQKNIDLLDSLEKRFENIPEEDYNLYYEPYHNKPVLMDIHKRLKKG